MKCYLRKLFTSKRILVGAAIVCVVLGLGGIIHTILMYEDERGVGLDGISDLQNGNQDWRHSTEKNRAVTSEELTENEVFSGIARLQDHPQLLNYIRQHVLFPPPPATKAFILSKSNPHKWPTEQEEIYRFVFNLLERKRSGFFIECGANDGETYSNTLPLELHHGWSGLLIEPDPQPLNKLLARGRHAWIAPVCLTEQLWPTKVKMVRQDNDDLLTRVGSAEVGERFTADCYPLFSLLEAINVTTVDYFSLDIEGQELYVLQTIPWSRVLIKVMSIEVPPYNNRGAVDLYMKSKGYKFVTYIKNYYSHDNIYIHSSVSYDDDVHNIDISSHSSIIVSSIL